MVTCSKQFSLGLHKGVEPNLWFGYLPSHLFFLLSTFPFANVCLPRAKALTFSPLNRDALVFFSSSHDPNRITRNGVYTSFTWQQITMREREGKKKSVAPLSGIRVHTRPHQRCWWCQERNCFSETPAALQGVLLRAYVLLSVLKGL